MRRTYTGDDRTATDPHGFAPVPESGIPRQRAERPVHDPWDPAHGPDRYGGDPYDDGPYGEERYPDAEYVPAGRRASRYDAPGTDGHGDEPDHHAAEDPRPRRRVDRRATDARRPRRGAPARPSRTGTSRTATARNASSPAGTARTETSPGGTSPGGTSPGGASRTGASRTGASRIGASRTGASRAAPVDQGTGRGPRIAAVAIPVAVGSLVAVAIGVWARVQEPTGVAVNLAGFSSAGAVKTWLATLALVLALAQGWTGMVLRGRVGAGPTPLVATVHRWSGRLAVLVTVPVAIQCLVALGWSGATPRALVHSLLGCVFYGAFVTKMLMLRRPGVPGWVVAVSGGALLAVLTGIWLTSALWFFGTSGLTF